MVGPASSRVPRTFASLVPVVPERCRPVVRTRPGTEPVLFAVLVGAFGMGAAGCGSSAPTTTSPNNPWRFGCLQRALGGAGGIAGRSSSLSSPYERVELLEAEVVPVALTVETGNLRISLPLGAFTRRGGRTRFVGTIDVVGLTAAILGIRVGGRGVRAVTPKFRSLAEKIRSGR